MSTIASVIHSPLLKEGLCFAASDALRHAGIPVSRIGQTLGSARASAGTHEADGNALGAPYCAAVDLRIRDLEEDAVKELLSQVASVGFAGFFRCPGKDHWPTTEVRHVHAVYCGVHMKQMLRSQVHDWLNGRNGLASHAPYSFWHPNAFQVNLCRTLFLAHNPSEG